MVNAQHPKNARTTIQTMKKKVKPTQKSRKNGLTTNQVINRKDKWPNNKLGDRFFKKGIFFENKDFE